MTELRAPRTWGQNDGKSAHWENVEIREVVYSDLDPEAAESIESLIAVRECSGHNIVRVHRLNPQTIEIVWYDDVGDGDDDDEHSGPSRVSNVIIKRVRGIIQGLFGEQWRVARKADERRESGSHPQRAIVRRASHQRFKYRLETEDDYRLKLYGKPDNAPEGVVRYEDLDAYPDPLDDLAGKDFDCYVYEAPSGTRHLIENGADDLRARVVAEPVPCACGQEVDPETAIDADRVNHYAEYVTDEAIREYDTLRPEHLFAEDLCGRCKQVFVPFRGAQSIRQYAMEVNND